MNENEYVFQLEAMDKLYCRFHGEGNEIAIVRLYDADMVHRYSVAFLSPAYIRCPLMWQGAAFRYANIKEKAEFLLPVSEETGSSWTSKGLDFEANFYEYQSLYLIDVDSDTDYPIQVQFLASSVNIKEQL